MSKTVGSSKEDKEWLKKELGNLKIMFTGGFKLEEDLKDKYAEALGDLRVDYLIELFTQMWSWKTNRLPTIAEIRDEYRKINLKHNPPPKDDRDPTKPVEVTKSDTQLRDTVMNCMYLYYKHRFDFFSNSEFVKEAYKKIFGDEPYDFNKFKSKITQEMVYKYVESNGQVKQAD